MNDVARPQVLARTAEPSPPPAKSRRKIVRIAIVAAVLGVLVIGGIAYWLHARHFVTTDDAYVNANTVDIAAQVAGQVTKVYVRDQQKVAAGDPLFDIDSRNYEAAVDKAVAQLALARQNVQQQSAAVDAARAQLAQRQAEEQNARHNNQRIQELVTQNFYSKQGGEQARTQALTAVAAVHAAEATLAQAQSALGAAGDTNASIRAAEATLTQARLDLEHTRVRAPATGMVANLSLRPGNTVAPGTPLFSIVSSEEYWVDANFKETELQRVRVNQKARVVVDMYPNHPFDGVVESLSAGSGSAFSLLPPQNATGNWVKVTQRVPVRVRIVDTSPDYPLRIGTTATVQITVD